MMEVTRKQLLHLALLTAGILLILAEYELYETQQKANPDIGKGCIVIIEYFKPRWTNVLIRIKGAVRFCVQYYGW